MLKKTSVLMLGLLSIFLILISCETESMMAVKPTDDSDDSGVAGLAKPEISTVYTIDEPQVPVGSATLNRSKNGISMTLQTSGIEVGSAVTVWWVIFNNAGECGTSPCGLADVFDPDVQTAVVYAAGHVVGGNGSSNFAGHRSVSDASGSAMPFFNELFGLNIPVVGLLDPLNSEVHLVVRTHEDAIPEFLPDMIQTFNGGCTYPDGVTPGITGVPGPNNCADIQGAIFQP